MNTEIIFSLIQSVVSPSLPFFIIGAGSLLAAALSLNLPETADAALSNTLEEAEAFGRDDGRGFFFMPLMDQYGLTRRKGARSVAAAAADTMAATARAAAGAAAAAEAEFEEVDM